MLTIRTVLHPTDFSAFAEAALPYAVDLARKHDAELRLLHVMHALGDDPLRGAYAALIDEDAFAERLRIAAEEQMDALAERHDVQGVRLSRVLLRGQPSHALLGYLDQEDVDLVVLGTHGRRGPHRMLLGSVAEAVARHAEAPVLVVPRETVQRPTFFERILAPLDFSACDLSALRHAKELAALYGAALELLHVVDPMEHMSLYTAGALHREAAEDYEEQSARKRLAQWYQSAVGPRGNVECRARTGYPPQEIIEAAQEHHADLIVLASHGQTALEQFPLGSVAERVLRLARCPVFVIKSFGKVLTEQDASPPAQAMAE